MIVSTVYNSMVREAWRIDARYFSDKGNAAYLRIHNGPWPKARLGDFIGQDNVWAPNIFTRVYATDKRFGKPYLAPHDTIRYMPDSREILSRSQVPSFQRLELQRGWLLVTCSGRNLGPCVWVDRYLERFVVSHDMVRVTGDAPLVFYIMAFLHTSTGRQLIRRDKNGSVIDHIDARQLRDLIVPLVDDALMQRCSRQFMEAGELREQARLTLDGAKSTFLHLTRLGGLLRAIPKEACRRRFELNASALGWRVDAEPHAPIYRAYEQAITATGMAHPLASLALVRKPHGRYSPLYVEDEQHGFRLMSGRQIAQYRPINLRYISPLSFGNPAEYRLQEGWLVMTADGRAEERLADCALVTEERADWGASGHVHRIQL